MASRDEILADVRRHLPLSEPLPDLTGPWIEYPDPIAQFASVLEMIGGRCVRVQNLEELALELAKVPAFSTAKQLVSRIPGLDVRPIAQPGALIVDLEQVTDPHHLDRVDFAILPGQWAVAENAAVWVDDVQLRHRVIYFLCQHLAFVVSAECVLHNMHQAYERLTFDTAKFGAFIAGPSKTADVEQSLVIGAHGPRSQTIFIVG